MNKLYAFQRLRMALLFILTLFVLHEKGLSQKNTIKITPLKFVFNKVNISYERSLNKEWSIIAGTQLWFLKNVKRPSEKNSNFSFVFTDSNKGSRFSLELRKYFFVKESDQKKVNFYLGLGGFTGNHDISMKRNPFSHISRDNLSGFTTRDFYPELNGAVDLISAGVQIDFGYQFIFQERLKLDFGFLIGHAWTNQENDFVTLINYEPYNLEPQKTQLSYTKGISGVFVQPMFSVGFSF